MVSHDVQFHHGVGFPAGLRLVTVFANGISSASSIVSVSVPVPTAPFLTGLTKAANGSIQFTFANTPGAVFGGLAATNLNLPLTNWTRVGGVTEAAPGQFQFLDSQATNYPQRFYVIRSF